MKNISLALVATFALATVAGALDLGNVAKTGTKAAGAAVTTTTTTAKEAARGEVQQKTNAVLGTPDTAKAPVVDTAKKAPAAPAVTAPAADSSKIAKKDAKADKKSVKASKKSTKKAAKTEKKADAKK